MPKVNVDDSTPIEESNKTVNANGDNLSANNNTINSDHTHIGNEITNKAYDNSSNNTINSDNTNSGNNSNNTTQIDNSNNTTQIDNSTSINNSSNPTSINNSTNTDNSTNANNSNNTTNINNSTSATNSNRVINTDNSQKIYTIHNYLNEKNRENDIAYAKELIDNYIYDFIPSKKISIAGYEKDIEADVAALDEERIIIIDSYDEDILLGAITKITKYPKYEHISKKNLRFDKGENTRTDILIQEIIDIAENSLLTVSINDKVGAENLIKQILHSDFKLAIGAYQSKLSSKGAYILIAVSKSPIIKLLNENESKHFVTRRKLPFLKYKLCSIFKNEPEILYGKIMSLREHDDWPADEEEFYQKIIAVLDEKPEDIKRLINGEIKYETIIIQNEEEAKKLVSDEDKLVRYIAYVAANFEKLSLNEFNFVVETLLADKVETVQKTRKVPEKTDEPFLIKRWIDTTDEKTEQPLLKRWADNADTILFKLQLTEYTTNKNKKVIGYKKTGFHKTFREQFISRWRLFNRQQFDYLFFSALLLFNNETPDAVFENLIQIAAGIANDEPDTYCRRLLLFTTISIINHKANLDFNIDPEADDFEEQFVGYIKKFKATSDELEIQKIEIFGKLSRLIAEMLTYQNLHEPIEEYFNILIDMGFHNAVLFFVKYLWAISGFNTLYWAKQLIDRGSREMQDEVFLFLLTKIGRQSFSDTLDSIKAWLPRNKELAKYAPSNLFSLKYILHSCINELINFPFQNYGIEYLRCAQFSVAQADVGKCKSQLNFLFLQLCADETASVFVEIDILASSYHSLSLCWSFEEIMSGLTQYDDFAVFFYDSNHTSFNFLVADIVEAWFHILHGFDNKCSPEAKELIDCLMKTFIELSLKKSECASAILKRWQIKPGIYKQYEKRITEYKKNCTTVIAEKDLQTIDSLLNSIKKRAVNISYLFEAFNQNYKTK